MGGRAACRRNVDCYRNTQGRCPGGVLGFCQLVIDVGFVGPHRGGRMPRYVGIRQRLAAQGVGVDRVEPV